VTVNQLTYFTVTGHWYDIEAPDTSGATNQPQFLVISAFVTFTPRLAPGTLEYITNLDLGFQIPAPTSLMVTPSTTGGTLTSGAKFWVVTATNANGETTRSNEVTATLTGSTSSAVLTAPAVDGATGWTIYRGTTAGSETTKVATVSGSGALNYTDTGATGTSASPPSTNTAEATTNTALALAPITARILEGELQTINRVDTPQLQLVANTGVLGLASLIYDVSFTNVVYANAGQTLTNFAFTAPTSATTIDLADPALTRLAYNPGAF
jgi:hypothetical protein